jgi:hypothetical protein
VKKENNPRSERRGLLVSDAHRTELMLSSNGCSHRHEVIIHHHELPDTKLPLAKSPYRRHAEAQAGHPDRLILGLSRRWLFPEKSVGSDCGKVRFQFFRTVIFDTHRDCRNLVVCVSDMAAQKEKLS